MGIYRAIRILKLLNDLEFANVIGGIDDSVRSADVRSEDVRCEDVRSGGVRCEDVRPEDVKA